MKKTLLIGLMAAFVFSVAFGSVVYAENSATSTPDKVKPVKSEKSTFDSACVVKAVEKRENAVIAAHEVLSTALKTALTKRKSALMAAWGLTDNKERRKARSDAWSVFRREQKEARKAHLNSVKMAWKEFKKESKGCKVEVSGTEPEGLDVSVSAAASNSANTQ